MTVPTTTLSARSIQANRRLFFYALTSALAGFLFGFDTALATNVELFIVARFIGGVGIGISTGAAPLYISEIAPPDRRGRLAAMFQFNIVLGIVIAFASNALLARLGPDAWRWMLGVAAIPSFIYMVMAFGLPESPRWLLTRKGDRFAAIQTLSLVMPGASLNELEATADTIVGGADSPPAPQGRGGQGVRTVWRLRVPIALAFLVAFFNQLSGINAILYFAPRIFSLTGLGQQAALLQSVGIGITNLIFTFVGLWLIDRLGRRTLLLIGSFGYIASLGLCSWAFYTGHVAIVPACIFAFIAAHAIGQGTVIWVLISEIFPNTYRAAGQSAGSATHWVFAALLTTVFPLMVSRLAPGTIFLFFCGMMALQLVWVLTMVPETKGVPLEEIQRRLGLAT